MEGLFHLIGEVVQLKISLSMQTDEFAFVKGFDNKSAFNWWIKCVLKKKDRIVANVRK